ncbi:MAG: tRNA pseudouridine(13) synthase TruD [Candidatus Acetothermia bacterium]|jgi:tRNA pseudouridine13 synthase|nr:tRNA pseudouridine(13) synthase TruD [Candidatus Acetothermia bacterium]
MRFKHVPEDFQVEELLSIRPEPRGTYPVYRVEKRGLPTLAVHDRLAARFGIAPGAVRFPALKDKDALAVQYCTVDTRSASTWVSGPGFSARRVGFLPRPLSPRDLAGNRFRIVLRDLDPEEVPALRARWEALACAGFPNYFDLQRFGSWSRRLGFPGKLILQGDVEGALRCYLAEPLVGDPPGVLRFKRLAREHWGDWATLKAHAPKSNLRSVLSFLADHPTELKKALNLVTPRVLSLWLSAYQSFLWNRTASRHLAWRLQEAGVPPAYLATPFGALVSPADGVLAPPLSELLRLEIPLLSHRTRITDPAMGSIVEEVLREEGLRLPDLRARALHRVYLGQGTRRLWAVPTEAAWLGEDEDERFPGRRRVTMTFTLPPGSYATLLLRALAPTA